jgi:uncharacterized membrane protein
MRLSELRYPDMDLGVRRLEALTDGMFAILMTILVLELTKFPNSWPLLDSASLSIPLHQTV